MLGLRKKKKRGGRKSLLCEGTFLAPLNQHSDSLLILTFLFIRIDQVEKENHSWFLRSNLCPASDPP